MRRLLAAVLVLGMLSYFAWQYVGSNVVAGRTQETVRKAIVQDLEAKRDTTVSLGGKQVDGVGLLSIPAIGIKNQPIVEGFTQDVMDRGVVGHTGVRPGETGNVVLGAHVVTHGEVFKAVDDLRYGDKITVRSSDGTFIYKVRASAVTVDSSAMWPLHPIPTANPLGGSKIGPALTLITCKSRLFRTSDRLVVIADLDSKGTP